MYRGVTKPFWLEGWWNYKARFGTKMSRKICHLRATLNFKICRSDWRAIFQSCREAGIFSKHNLFLCFHMFQAAKIEISLNSYCCQVCAAWSNMSCISILVSQFMFIDCQQVLLNVHVKNMCLFICFQWLWVAEYAWVVIPYVEVSSA